MNVSFSGVGDIFHLLQSAITFFLELCTETIDCEESTMWAPAHLIDLLILKLSTHTNSIVHVTENDNMEANVCWNTHHNDYLLGLPSALSIVPNTEASTFDEILGLLQSWHWQRINL